MSAETVAKVFSGQITRWDDAALAADNPGVELPDLGIIVVHRSDDSGTTKNLTDYLSKAAPRTWTWEAAETWPADLSAFQSDDLYIFSPVLTMVPILQYQLCDAHLPTNSSF